MTTTTAIDAAPREAGGLDARLYAAVLDGPLLHDLAHLIVEEEKRRASGLRRR